MNITSKLVRTCASYICMWLFNQHCGNFSGHLPDWMIFTVQIKHKVHPQMRFADQADLTICTSDRALQCGKLRRKDKRKIENDAIALDDEGGLKEVEEG